MLGLYTKTFSSFLHFFLFKYVFCPTFLLPCLPSFSSQEGFGRRFPSSTAVTMCEFPHELVAFNCLSSSDVRKKSQFVFDLAENRPHDLIRQNEG